MDICTLNFNVTLPDVGEKNMLTNKGILRMLQEAACIHSSDSGISINTTEKDGIAWVVLNWKLKVFSRPCWNSSIKINTWTRKISRIFFYRDFEVYDDKNNLIAIATSKWILYDLNKQSIANISQEIKARYIIVNKNVFDEPIEEKIKAPEKYEISSSYTVLKRDIDTNHHVNNLNYLDFASEVLPNNHEGFNNVEIFYKLSAKYGDSINIFYSVEKDKHYISMKNSTNNLLYCIVKLY